MASIRDALNLLSARGKAINGKQYVDEFGVVYKGNHKGKLEKVSGTTITGTTNAVSTVTDTTAEDLIAALTLSSLTDVNINNIQPNQYLYYNGTSWVNGDLGGGSDTLIDLGNRLTGSEIIDLGYRL